MAILIARLESIIYQSGHYTVYQIKHGRCRSVATYKGNPMRKSKKRDWQLSGEWETHPAYGKRFVISDAKDVGFVPTTQAAFDARHGSHCIDSA